jgi:hypothetical protein
VDQKAITISAEDGTMWMIMSPYLIARFMFDIIYVSQNEAPDLMTLHANLRENFNLGMKYSTLEEWHRQFIFIH